MSDDEWTVLQHFTSEVEGRVAESFLTSHGVEVRLFDTHINYIQAVRASSDGLRLMVRSRDLERARNLLEDARRPTHLEVVGEELPIRKTRVERWIFFLLVALAALVFVLMKFGQ